MGGSFESGGVYSYDATGGSNSRWVTTADEFQTHRPTIAPNHVEGGADYMPSPPISGVQVGDNTLGKFDQWLDRQRLHLHVGH